MKDENLVLGVGINRDLFDDEGDDMISFYREYKNQVFDYAFELNRNLAGYSRDVHGQLNIIMNNTKQGT